MLSVKLYIMVSLDFISLITSEGENLSIYVLSILVSFYVKCSMYIWFSWFLFTNIINSG